MSKELLNENTIRKFMKLANIQPLANGFVEKSKPLKEEAEEVQETAKRETRRTRHRSKYAS